MRGYDRDEYDDYEGYDDYEDEGGEEYEEEGEEAEYEEERPKPTKEEMEYLELRQKLKESIRKKMKKESSTSLSDSNSRKKLPYDNYGSFFGPSQPVISQRVIEESKSLIGNPDLAARISKAAHVNKNTNKASNGSVKSSTHSQMPKASEKQVKAQKLKVIRDYSFLMSDDAELPAPTKVSPSQNTSIRNNGFLLMLKREDQLNLLEGISNLLPMVVASMFVAVVRKGEQFLEGIDCLPNQT